MLSLPQSCTSHLIHTACTIALAYLPSLRHCLINPPEDIFFSASISLKFRELANTRTSTIAMRRLRNVTAVSADMPCVTSMFSSSVFKKGELIFFQIGKKKMVHVTYSTGEKSLESLSKNIKNKLILPITRPCQFFSQPTILKKIQFKMY